MIQYRIICALQGSLSEEEFRKLKKNLIRKDRLCRLNDILLKNKTHDIKLVLVDLYGDDRKSSRDAFRKLCEKYIEIIVFSVMDVDISLWNFFDYKNANQASEAIKKNILIIQLLEQRGVPHEWLLDSIQKFAAICKNFGLLEDLVIVLMHQYHLQLRASNETGAIEVLRQQVDVSEALRFVMDMELFIYHYFENSGSGFEFDQNKILELERKVSECQLMYQKTGLVFLFFIQLVLQVRIFYSKLDFQTAHKLLYQLYLLTRNYSEIIYRLETGSLGAVGGRSMSGFFENGHSLEWIQHSELLRFPSFYAKVLEPLVFELYYTERYVDAEKILNGLIFLNHNLKENKSFSKYFLLMGYLQLQMGDQAKVSVFIQKASETMNQSFQWIIGLRMLQIYFMVHLKEWTFVKLRIDSLRKFVERNAGRTELRERDHVILRLLMCFSRLNFDFEKVCTLHKRELYLLQSGDPGLKWLPGSFEYLAFDRWLISHAQGWEASNSKSNILKGINLAC